MGAVPEIDAREAVLAALAHAGIHPAEDEVDAFVAAFPATRQRVAQLYTLPGVRRELPAMVFQPRVTRA